MDGPRLPDFDGSLGDEILKTVEIPIVVLDRHGGIVRFNDASERLTGFAAADVLGKKVWDFLIVDDEIAVVRDVFEKTCGEETPTHFVNFWKTKGGERRLIQWANRKLADRNGVTAYVLATGIDITESVSREAALSESQAFLRSIIDASPVAVITINENGRILTFSAEAEKTFGYKEAEVLGENVSLLMPEPFRSAHDGYIEHYKSTGEKRIIGRARPVTAMRKDGDVFPAVLHVSEFADNKRVFVGFVEDATEQEATKHRLQETQAQLIHAGRVGELGEMATSIAHELNQPLTASASLVGAVALTLKKFEFAGRDKSISLLDDAVGEIKRASEIIRHMRELVRKQPTAKRLYDINKVVDEACAVAFIGAESAGINVVTDFDPGAGSALLDRTQIQQVVINLIRNAIDAMGDSGTKKLTITTRKAGQLIEVKVADTGSGIPQALKNSLFEPFVTSKENGLGVGLSISKSIIEAHEGALEAGDNDPVGSVFRLSIPSEAREHAT